MENVAMEMPRNCFRGLGFIDEIIATTARHRNLRLSKREVNEMTQAVRNEIADRLPSTHYGVKKLALDALERAFITAERTRP